jgi:alpha/beta superfamily hydrolase
MGCGTISAPRTRSGGNSCGGDVLTIENFLLEGPAGRIECLIKHPPPGGTDISAAAVVCHPHPLFGGTMHNKVVHAAASALEKAGIPALRFNFRGVGLSAGRHDGGHGEQDDTRVVLDNLASRYPGLPLIVSGYSFGAFVGLKTGCGDARVRALIGIGVPVSLYDFSFLTRCDRQITFIQGAQDQFGALPLVMAMAASLPHGARVLPVAGAGHNFDGQLEALARRMDEAIPTPG